MPIRFTSQPAPALTFRKTAGLFLAILCAWLFRFPVAQGQHIERLTVDEGLSQGFVHSVIQTRDGFLWVATLDGLNRYDGVGFKVYRNDPADPYSLNSDFVLELMEDSRGILWVLTDRGPNLFDPVSGRFYHPNGANQFSASSINPLRSLREDRFGRLWAIFDTEIVRFEFPAGDTPKAAADSMRMRTGFLSKNQLGIVYSLSALDSALWIASEKGCFALSYVDEILRPLSFLPAVDIAYIWQDTFSGAVWLQGAHGLSRWSGGRLSTFAIEGYENGMVCGWSGPKGTYFFSKTRIHRWENGVCVTLPGQIPEIILSACEDRNGVIWLGTNAHGLCKALLGRAQFASYQEGISQTGIPVEDRSGNLWVYGTQADTPGYYRFDAVSGQLKEPLNNRLQYSLVNGRDGGFWFLSAGGELYHIDRPGAGARRYGKAIAGNAQTGNLLQDSRGRLGYLTFDGQMTFFDPRTAKWSTWSFAYLFDPAQLPSPSSFLEDARGCFWIGTSNGLIEATPGENGRNYRFRLYGSADGLSRQRILSLSADPWKPDRLWIGTQHGLNWLDFSTGKFEALTLGDGLPNDVIYSILPANDSILWVGTNSGLLRINHRSRRWRHFTKNDGLPGSEFNTGAALRLRDGRLVFGGVGGFVVFHPDDMVVSPIQPGLAITEIWINSRPYQGTSDTALPIRLNHDQNYVSFRFALLDFVNPASNRYQYRLIGANNNWTPLSSDNSVTFSNLQPGHYQIEVRGVNSEGIESKIARHKFVISPPWWRSVWAFVAYGMAALLGAGVFFQWRRRQRRFRENLAAEHREAERLKTLDQFKSRLYANITHEFRTPLTVILGVAKQLEQDPANQERTSLIARNGEQLLRLVNQMLDWSKLENSQLRLRPQRFEVVGFLHMAAGTFLALAQSKDLALDFDFPDGALWIDADPDRLNDIVSNLLTNAIKFTPPGGRVALQISIESENTLCIAVEDTGIGIAPEHLPRIFDRFYQIDAPDKGTGGAGIGLSYAQELAQMMGGLLTASSAPGKGTRIQLALPQAVPPRLTDGEAIPARRAETPPAGPENAELPLVLLIEDNADVARYTADCLAGHFAVVWVSDGSAGLAKALELVPDLVLSDVMLPGIDGFELCAALKNDPRTNHVPVVLLTARADGDSRLKGLQHGAAAYLVKPFQQAELLLKLDNLLRLRMAMQARHTTIFHKRFSAEAKPDTAPAQLEDPFVQRVFALIAAHYADPDFSAAKLQRAVHLSSAQLHRKMLALTGKPPGHFLRLHRLEQSRKILRESPDAAIAEVAYRVGYRDANYFSRAFVQEFGLSPGAYRRQRS